MKGIDIDLATSIIAQERGIELEEKGGVLTGKHRIFI
jgi:hypothetical protein